MTRTPRTPLATILPDFPWDSLAAAKSRAGEHPDGIVNLSVGTPVDPVAPGIQIALSEAAGFSGYPQTIGTPELRSAIRSALERRYDIDFRRYFSAAIEKMQPPVDDGLVRTEANRITVTSRGRLLLRNIAMCFDRYLDQPAVVATPRFSRAI